MTHAPPNPTRPAIWTPPARRLIVPPRTPRLRAPRWWRRSADLLAMALKPAFKDGKPLFVDGKPAFTEDPCTCCGTTGCTDLYGIPTHCAACAGATPNKALVAITGGTPACFASGGASYNVDTVDGSHNCFYTGTACNWQYFEFASSPVVRQFRRYTNATCSGAASSSINWQANVTIQDQSAWGRGVVVRLMTVANTGLAPVPLIAFCGQAALTGGCFGTYVISNGGYYDNATGPTNPNVGSGGTATVTFCP